MARSSSAANTGGTRVRGRRHSGERSSPWRHRQYLIGIGLASRNSSGTIVSSPDQMRRAPRWSLAILRRAVVIGADRDDAGEIVMIKPVQHLQRLGRRIAADADKHRHASGDDRERAFDERLALVVIQGRALAGRAERKDPAYPGGDVMLDERL